MIQPPPKTLVEFLTNLPNSIGTPFWFGLAILAIGLFIIFGSSFQFGSDLQSLEQARKELNHLLKKTYKSTSSPYRHEVFNVPSTVHKDELYELELRSVTLKRKIEIFEREKYTERDSDGDQVTRYRNVWKLQKSENIYNPELIPLRKFKLPSQYLKTVDISISTPLPSSSIHLLGMRQVHEEGYIRFVPDDREDDELYYGDKRISYSGATEQTISAIAEYKEGILKPYEMNSVDFLLEHGEKSAKQLLTNFQSSSKASIVVGVFVGGLLLVVGAMSIYAAYLGRPMTGSDALSFLRQSGYLGFGSVLLGILSGYLWTLYI